MSNSWDWAERIFSQEDMVEIAARSDQILFDNENGFMVNIQLTNEQCMELVEHWWNSQDEDTRHDVIESYDYIEGFLANFIDFLENYLNHQLEGWQERRYGYED